jgi:hypothetical protein
LTNVIAPTDSERFTVLDVVELARWPGRSEPCCRFLQLGPDAAGGGEDTWIAATDDGSEYISVARGSPYADDGAEFAIMVREGRYELVDGQCEPLRTYRTLAAAFDGMREHCQHCRHHQHCLGETVEDD